MPCLLEDCPAAPEEEEEEEGAIPSSPSAPGGIRSPKGSPEGIHCSLLLPNRDLILGLTGGSIQRWRATGEGSWSLAWHANSQASHGGGGGSGSRDR